MQIKQVDAVGAQLLQAGLEGFNDLVVCVEAGLIRIDDLGGEGQAPLFPLGLPSEGLLLLAHVDAGGVDLIVASGLEDVEDFVELAKVGDACSVCLVWPLVIVLVHSVSLKAKTEKG